MCFTPKVTLATLILEWSFAGWTWLKYRTSYFGRLIALLLLLLGLFQGSEYAICRGGDPILWSRIGFATIAFLPATGLHLISLLNTYSGQHTRLHWLTTVIVPIGYVSAMAWAILFLAGSRGIQSAECYTRFILYRHDTAFYFWFGVYYAVMLAWALEAMIFLYQQSAGALRSMSGWLAVGYCSFIVPTYIVIFIVPMMKRGFPSVLCGFAIFLAVILVTKVLPLSRTLQPALR